MANQIPFEEVDWNNSGAPESRWEIDEPENAPYEAGEAVHVYLVFAPGISVEEGIELIEREALSGGTLDVQRRDTAGNAVAAIMTYEQQQKAEALSQVVSAEISEAAEPHDSAANNSTAHSSAGEQGQEPKLPDTEEKTQAADASRAERDTEMTQGVTEESLGKLAGAHTTAAYLSRGMIIIAAVLVFLWMAYRRRTGKR